MTLTPHHNATVESNIDAELDVQTLLVRARTAAAKKLVTYFEAEDHADTKVPPAITAAISFTARPFQPFQTLLRTAAQHAAKQDDTANDHDSNEAPTPPPPAPPRQANATTTTPPAPRQHVTDPAHLSMSNNQKLTRGQQSIMQAGMRSARTRKQ